MPVQYSPRHISSVVVLGHFPDTAGLGGKGEHSCAGSAPEPSCDSHTLLVLSSLLSGGCCHLAQGWGCLCLPTAPGKLQEVAGFLSHSLSSVAASLPGRTVSWWGIYPCLERLEVGSSSGGGCVLMLTWGSKSVMSHRCHTGLKLGNLQSLSFLAHTHRSTWHRGCTILVVPSLCPYVLYSSIDTLGSLAVSSSLST